MESLLDSIFYLRAKYYLVKIFFNVFFIDKKIVSLHINI